MAKTALNFSRSSGCYGRLRRRRSNRPPPGALKAGHIDGMAGAGAVLSFGVRAVEVELVKVSRLLFSGDPGSSSRPSHWLLQPTSKTPARGPPIQSAAYPLLPVQWKESIRLLPYLEEIIVGDVRAAFVVASVMRRICAAVVSQVCRPPPYGACSVLGGTGRPRGASIGPLANVRLRRLCGRYLSRGRIVVRC